MIKYLLLHIILCYCLTNITFPQIQNPKGKCLTFFLLEEKLHPSQEKNAYEKNFILDRGIITQKNILSPSGKFRIHFDTIGTHAPALVNAQGERIPNTVSQYVDTLSKIFDITWEKEINQYGFSVPPSDNGEGGGNEYDIYIQDLGTSNFGYTSWGDTPLNPNKQNPQYPTWIVIDNDFGKGFRTLGIEALSATAAHEFHHAVQVGGSGIWTSDDFYFYELSAESMEPTVFPFTKDYVHDVVTYFGNTGSIPLWNSFNSNWAGYERALFGIFLMTKYKTTNIMKDIWSAIETMPPWQAMENVLSQSPYSSTTAKEFADFSVWNFYTGSRADTINYYKDGKYFPELTYSTSTNFLSDTSKKIIETSVKSFTASYHCTTRIFDTLYCLVTNINENDAVANIHGQFPYTLNITAFNEEGSQKISNSIFAKFSVSDANNWKFLTFASGGGIAADVSPFPNPFNPHSSLLYIPIENVPSANATIQIFSSSYDLVFNSIAKPAQFLGKYYLAWNGKDKNNNMVGSGIYFFIIAENGNIRKGKFAVVR